MKIESLNIQQVASYSYPLVTIILDALDYANVHRIDPNHLQIRLSLGQLEPYCIRICNVYAGDFNTLLDYEVTFVLDALDQANIQRIVPNCLHIRRPSYFVQIEKKENSLQVLHPQSTYDFKKLRNHKKQVISPSKLENSLVQETCSGALLWKGTGCLFLKDFFAIYWYSYMSGWVYGHSNGANIRKCQRAVEN
nr:hypothetical protein CFP56_35462 [Quercus suber]